MLDTEPLALVAALIKVAGYGAALLSIGGPLFLAAFPAAGEDIRRLARRVTMVAAVLLLGVLVLRLGIRAARISGMGLAGATDPVMLGLVADGPLGTAALWQGAGVILVLCLALPGQVGRFAGLTGAGCIAVSFALVGHSLGEPRGLLGPLVVAHVLGAAFWIGALVPLHRAAAGSDGATLLNRFGKVATGTVAVLVVAGCAFAWLAAGSLSALTNSVWGGILLLKLGCVAGLLVLAADNRWRLVPALAVGKPGVSSALRRSIRTEIVLVVLILLATAALTTLTSPPVGAGSP